MVATSGSWGRLAPSLVTMVNEADRLAPNRSKTSDGSLGDAAHAARSSFHNPLDGYVDALDLTHDPLNGWDVHARAGELVARGDGRLDHVISDRQIWSAAQPVWRSYTGTNPHIHHAHFAVRRNLAGRSPTGLWWPAVAVTVPTPVPPPIPEDDEMFSYEFKSGTQTVLRVVVGDKQTRITGQLEQAQLRANPRHLVLSDAANVTRFDANYGSAG